MMKAYLVESPDMWWAKTKLGTQEALEYFPKIM